MKKVVMGLIWLGRWDECFFSINAIKTFFVSEENCDCTRGLSVQEDCG